MLKSSGLEIIPARQSDQGPTEPGGEVWTWLGSARLGSVQRGSYASTHSPPLSPGCEIEGGRKGGCKQKFPQQTVNQSRLQTPGLSKHGRRWRGEPKQSVRGRRREARVSPTNIWIKYITAAPRKLIGPPHTPPPHPPPWTVAAAISHSPRCGRAFSSQPPWLIKELRGQSTRASIRAVTAHLSVLISGDI